MPGNKEGSWGKNLPILNCLSALCLTLLLCIFSTLWYSCSKPINCSLTPLTWAFLPLSPEVRVLTVLMRDLMEVESWRVSSTVCESSGGGPEGELRDWEWSVCKRNRQRSLQYATTQGEHRERALRARGRRTLIWVMLPLS